MTGTGIAPIPDELLLRLRRFHEDYFPSVKDRFQSLVKDGSARASCSSAFRLAPGSRPAHRHRAGVRLVLRGWHYVIEDGEVHVFDLRSGRFVPASNADHSGTGPFDHTPVDGRIFNEIDAAISSMPINYLNAAQAYSSSHVSSLFDVAQAP